MVLVKEQMMAAVLYGKEHLEVEPVAVPQIGKGDVLVRVRAALTCGTDVKVFRRGYHARMIVPPALFGHELAGDIVAVGADVKGFPCRPASRSGKLRSLPRMLSTASAASKTFAKICCSTTALTRSTFAFPTRIVKRNMYEIPAHISYQDAALIEPLACVLRGLEETHVRPGDNVAVIGLGPIGLMFVRLAKVYGARVIAIGRRPTQLDRAARMGAEELLNTSTEARHRRQRP